MSEDRTYEGGCLCGAVRYRVTGRPIWTAFCHCRSCRRATGSAVAAYAGYAADRFEVTKGAATHFASSDGVSRGFCPRCGSPLTRASAELDHIRPRKQFKRPEDAESFPNHQLLCHACHAQKTQSD